MARSKTTSVAPNITVSTSGLSDLQKWLKAAADGTDKRLKAGLKDAGSIAAKKAQQNAEWSQAISSSIKTSVGTKNVAVTAGGRKAPQAISYEVHGKHPVFSKNRKRWNKKPLIRPFLKPAAEDTADQVADAVASAVADISQ